MGRGSTRRKTRGSPGGGGGQKTCPGLLVPFLLGPVYVHKLGVSGQSPLQLGAGCGLRERPGACAQVVAVQVAHESPSSGCQGWRLLSLATIQHVGAPGSW